MASKEQLDQWRREAYLKDYPWSAIRDNPESWRERAAEARATPQFWSRCQALAKVARLGPPEQVLPLVDDALLEAAKEPDLYHAVFPTAWPIRALIERGLIIDAIQRLSPIIEKTRGVQPNSSRSEALHTLVQAAIPGGEACWRPVMDALVESCIPPEHWRQARNLISAILFAERLDPELATSVAARITDARIRRKLDRELQARGHQKPRDFFW